MFCTFRFLFVGDVIVPRSLVILSTSTTIPSLQESSNPRQFSISMSIWKCIYSFPFVYCSVLFFSVISDLSFLTSLVSGSYLMCQIYFYYRLYGFVFILSYWVCKPSQDICYVVSLLGIVRVLVFLGKLLFHSVVTNISTFSTPRYVYIS